MADAIGNKAAHDYHLDVPAPEQGFFAKGLGHGDWGAKNRLSRLFNPKSGNTVMLAFDHGYIMSCPANLWFAGEAYWENIHTSMGDQYANTLQSLMPSWMLYVGFALLFVGGILGALLGHKMLKKHFERAGIV